MKGRLDETETTPVNTVTETVVVPPSGMLEGVTLQVELAGIPAQRQLAKGVILVRPLLQATREQTRAACAAANLPRLVKPQLMWSL